MAVTDNLEAQAGSLTHETMVIDLDVHERPEQSIGIERLGKYLVPYMDRHWARYLTHEAGEWQGYPLAAPYVAPYARAGVREDWLHDDESRSTLDDMRIDLIEREGVTVPVLNGPLLHASSLPGDPDFALALSRAYNEYQVAEWLDKDSRLRGSVHVAGQLPEEAAREIDRMAQHPQIIQVTLPLVASRQWGDPFYRPIWEAAVRNELPVTFHHSGASATLIQPRYFIEWHTMAAPATAKHQVMSLIVNGTFDRYPELKVVMLEAGVTWIFWLMWRLDQQYRELRANVPWVKRLPSEHIRDNVKVATHPITEVTSSQFQTLVEMTDTERVFVFASDYPHYDADSANVLDKLPDDLRYKIRYQNALEIFPSLRGLLREA
jgi:uncharacterized protein